MSALPQDFGAMTPGDQHMSATGVTPSTAAQIYRKYSVFTTVLSGAYAQLPRTNAAFVELIVMPRGGNDLLVIPDTGGQIESYGTNAAVTVLDGQNATFVCLDPPLSQGRQWWIK